MAANSVGDFRTQTYQAMQQGALKGVSEMSTAFLEEAIGGIPTIVLKVARFFWENRSVRMSNETQAQEYREEEREKHRVVVRGAPEFLGKGFVVKREPSPPKYGKFSSEDVPYGPGIRNMMRGTQEVEVLKGRRATAYLRVQEAAQQLLKYHGELGRCEQVQIHMQEELRLLDAEREHAYLPKNYDSVFRACESLRRQIEEGKQNLGAMRRYEQFVADEFRAAVQRSDVAKQQLKNHFDMDGLFW